MHFGLWFDQWYGPWFLGEGALPGSASAAIGGVGQLSGVVTATGSLEASLAGAGQLDGGLSGDAGSGELQASVSGSGSVFGALSDTVVVIPLPVASGSYVGSLHAKGFSPKEEDSFDDEEEELVLMLAMGIPFMAGAWNEP